jgi:hypothetical protein
LLAVRITYEACDEKYKKNFACFRDSIRESSTIKGTSEAIDFLGNLLRAFAFALNVTAHTISKMTVTRPAWTIFPLMTFNGV